MFLKNPKPRQFEYRPRFFKPESDDENEGPRIKFRRLTERKKPDEKRSVIGMLVFIIILIFLLRYLYKMNKSHNEYEPMKEIKIEIIG